MGIMHGTAGTKPPYLEVALTELPDRQDLDLAKERTDLAQERNLLASERTFSAWIRTGLAAVASGLGIAHLLGSTGWAWVPRAIGAILVLTGGGIYIVALWRYYEGYQKLGPKGLRRLPMWLLCLLTLALVVSAILGFILLFQPVESWKIGGR